jgi:uncharacterized heparinase superfamily protein
MASALANVAARRAGRVLRSPWRLLSRLTGGAPTRLLIAPSDIRTADATIADDIYAGFFAFAGKVVNTHGDIVFDAEAPSRAWAEALAGFGWLRHLRAAETPLTRANARVLVADWLAARAPRGRDRPDWEPRVAARRLLSWLSQSPLLLEDVDADFYRRFMKSLGRHAGALWDGLDGVLEGADRIVALAALAELGLCAEGMAKLSRRATRALALELDRQILEDGGHISRDPQAALDLVLDLLPLRQAYVSRGRSPPPQLINGIDRMLPMLRLFRHGDGSLALFNGMGATMPDQLAAALAHDDARAAALLDASRSGYQRLEAENAALIMDTGAPPPLEFSRRAHAGGLAFEFCAGGAKLVTNCGAPPAAFPEMRGAARSTAAHSALVVADTSSRRFAPDEGLTRPIAGRVIDVGPQASSSRGGTAEETFVAASHDGYAREFGLVHERVVALARDGSALRGEDRLRPADAGPAVAAPYAIRFHTHHANALDALDDGSVVITPAAGPRWLFRATAPATVEDSVYFAAIDRPRKTAQIVVVGDSAASPSVSWSFERIDEGEEAG